MARDHFLEISFFKKIDFSIYLAQTNFKDDSLTMSHKEQRKNKNTEKRFLKLYV